MRTMPQFGNTDGYQFAGSGMDSGGGGSLPIASADVLGGVKIGANLSITSEGVLSAISSNAYSTDEAVVGSWIDGSSIYRKVIAFTSQYDQGQHVSTDLTNLRMLFIDGCLVGTDGYIRPLTSNTGTVSENLRFQNSTGTLVWSTASAGTTYLILTYVKGA